MSSPMHDLPEHLRFPLTVDGRGPALGEDFDHWGCWCADPDCELWHCQARMTVAMMAQLPLDCILDPGHDGAHRDRATNARWLP